MRAALVVLAAAAAAVGAPLALADSFAPVRLTISVSPVARLHKPLRITVSVSADASVLDDHDGPLRAEVKLASECGGTFQTTPGPVLLDKALTPQPTTGQPYQGSASGSGRPTSYGTQTVCAYLDDDYLMYANDTTAPPQVSVSKQCTLAAARYDKRRTRHNRRTARRACGPGVPL